MALLEIVFAPDERLKTKCAPIEAVTDDIKALAQDMLDTMYKAPGIGLAAPQIGVLKQLVVLDVADKDSPPAPMVLINPEITWFSEERSVYKEGCLSIPDAYADVERPAKIKLRYVDLDGQTHEIEAEGLLATCLQHEIDHINGVLFTDHLPALRRSMIMTKMRKLKRERQRDAKRAG